MVVVLLKAEHSAHNYIHKSGHLQLTKRDLILLL